MTTRTTDPSLRSRSTSLCRCVVPTRTRLDQRDIHGFKLEARLVGVGGEVCFRRLQELFIVALWEIWLVVRPARLVAHGRTLGNDARQLQHVVKLARERERRVRPCRAIA